MSQLYHTAWTAKDGAPTAIESLAQTSDGYLWIASAAGLFRFDGVRFERIDEIDGQRLPSNNVMSLFAPPSGGLWIGYRFGGASFIRDDKIRSFGAAEGLPGGSVTDFAADAAGVMWASTAWGVRRFNGSLWEDVREELNLPSDYVKDLAAARDGAIWIVIGHDVMVMQPHQAVFTAAGIQTSEGDVDFFRTRDGTLWLADATLGAHPLSGPGAESGARDKWIALRDVRGDALLGKLVDRDGTLWMASPRGIHRLKSVGAASADFYSDVEGLSSSLASAFLEDREGNVWIGTAGGLDRFREARLTRVELPQASDGFALAPGEAGAMLIGIDNNEGLFKATGPSTVTLEHGPEHINCAYRTDDGVVWVGGRAKLWRSNGSQWTPLSVPVDSANADYYPVQGITQDSAGRLWVSVVREGVMRLDDQGHWTKLAEPSLSLASGADGRVWLGYPKNQLQVIDSRSGAARDFGRGDGLDLGNILSIYPQDKQSWVGGELGLARFDGTRFHSVALRGGHSLSNVSGIIATPAGDLWLSTSDGAIKIAADEARRFALDPNYAVRHELFDFLDGMPGTPAAIRPLPTIAAGTDGRLWFSTSSGIVWIDPQHLRSNSLRPNVELQSIVADGKRYRAGPDLRLPIKARNLQIDYTALSLSIPERVRFRYQLGAGEPWQDAGTRRAAYFTDLGPGNYTFRVIAANNDGLWNETGAALEFTIPPAFYQTRWFYALCALAFLAVLTVAYRVRVRQVAAQVRGRLEERLAERERIARDLHDTLLQGIQGLIWKFQAASDRIPPDEPARQLMEQSLDRADKLLEESRDKVKDLRPAARHVTDLAQALATEGEQFAKLHSAQFRVSVQGTPRDLHPIVREEGFLVAREALANAFRHAAAASIEAEVTYGELALHVRIRDDGRGIDTAVLDAGGRPGHFGLIGMRERAKKLGAGIEVWSKPGAGTEIDLRVPAEVAYRRSQSAAHGWRFRLGASS